MRAKDIMVTEVITVGPQASVRDVAKLLLSNRISAVPVVDRAGSGFFDRAINGISA
jgi:CBS domain-containing protein